MSTNTKTDTFETFRTIIDGQTCYFAGLPGYPQNFSRDTLISGILASNHDLLASQIAISSTYQGRQYDRLTGEEPGKIHHEYPGVAVRPPYLTTYNACDTTALYLIGLEALCQENDLDQASFVATHHQNIDQAVVYIMRHLKQDIFWEFPPPGTKIFSLKATYWKDSVLPHAGGTADPEYPVAYALAHFQAARGMQAAAKLLENELLARTADAMFQAGIQTFIRIDSFCIALDDKHRLEQISSDELHALAYIPANYAKLLPLGAIATRAKALETSVGLACNPQNIGKALADQYHGYVVWIFEQAFIHYAANKFGLGDIATITERCIPYIGEGQELFAVSPQVAPLGNDRQLWSVAADKYFANNLGQQQLAWL